MTKPTIASLLAEITELKSALTLVTNKALDLGEYKQQHQPLKDRVEQLEKELDNSRDQTNQIIYRLRERLSFLRDLRDLRANYVNALETGAPAEVIEKLRIRFHASTVDLVTLDFNEPDVEMIMERLSHHRPSVGLHDFGQPMAISHRREPLLFPKQPPTPYGA